MNASEPPRTLTRTSPGPAWPLVAMIRVPTQPTTEESSGTGSHSPYRPYSDAHDIPAVPHQVVTLCINTANLRRWPAVATRPILLRGERRGETTARSPRSASTARRADDRSAAGPQRNNSTRRHVPRSRWCVVSPGPHPLPSRNTVRLEPRCATRREATSHQPRHALASTCSRGRCPVRASFGPAGPLPPGARLPRSARSVRPAARLRPGGSYPRAASRTVSTSAAGREAAGQISEGVAAGGRSTAARRARHAG